MTIKDFFINRLVKNSRGFSPGKKIMNDLTIYDLSMTLLAMMLIKYARKVGNIDEYRMSILERVHGHFNEHVMFRESPRSRAIGVFSDMDADYSSMGRSTFEDHYEKFGREVGTLLPKIVNKEILAHLAMFQRVDAYASDNIERESSIRDTHALLIGDVDQSDISEILNVAAGYVIEPNRNLK